MLVVASCWAFPIKRNQTRNTVQTTETFFWSIYRAYKEYCIRRVPRCLVIVFFGSNSHPSSPIINITAGLPCPSVPLYESFFHRSNMGFDLQSLFGLHVHSCTHWLIPRKPPHGPALGSYTRALLVSQDRRHLFVTLCLLLSAQWGEQARTT